MKIRIMISFLFLYINHLGAFQTDEKRFYDALNLIEKGNFELAQEIVESLIDNHPHSKQIHNYYLTLDEIFIKIVDSLNKKIEPNESKQNDLEKGTVFIKYGKQKALDIDNVYKKRSQYLERYIHNFSDGIYREQFLSELLFLYSKKEKEKHKVIAKELTSSRFIESRKYGFFFLAIFAHEEKNYDSAIQYYKQMQEITFDYFELAKIQLYIADCFYNKKEYENALTNLKKIYEFEKHLKEKRISKVADVWESFYLEAINNSKEFQPKQFVFFN